MTEITEHKASGFALRGVVLCATGVAVAVVALGLFLAGVHPAAYGIVAGGCLVLAAIVSDYISGDFGL